jgi:hypothetical protein
MKPVHRIFVSAENNPYCGWQTKLFYFSCVTRLNHQPTIIVHDSGRSWHSDFYDLVKAGAKVVSAPGYAQGPYDRYPPRNTAGTLIRAAEMCRADELIVLCDPDMIFVSEPDFPESLSGNYYSYLDYDGAEVVAATKRFKVANAKLAKQKNELRCGVPYVIPAAHARRLGELWLQAVDAFEPRSWVDIMHAFGLAVVRLGLRVTLTDLADFDQEPKARVRRSMIHYCYGDKTWEKRNFYTEEQAKEVWFPSVEATRGSVLGEILSQLVEARHFYGSPYFQHAPVVSRGIQNRKR